MDIYSKGVLTVIAVSLSVIALQNMGVVPAVAQPRQQPIPVLICSPYNYDYCADVSKGQLQVSSAPN